MVPTTCKEPVKSKVLDEVINLSCAEPLVALELDRNCMEPVGPAAWPPPAPEPAQSTYAHLILAINYLLRKWCKPL